MSFFKCCVGADPRSQPDDGRPVSRTLSRRGGAHSAFASDGGASKRKMKLPTEVFYDPTKPDGQLSSITDPANSMRDVVDMKKRRDTRDRGSSTTQGRKLSVKVGMASNDDIHSPHYYNNYHAQQPQQQVQQNSDSNLNHHHYHHHHSHHQRSHSNNNAQQLHSASNNHPPSSNSPQQQANTSMHSQHHHHSSSHHKTDLDAQDNNGLTRGQNFMKVEKWLRQSCLVEQIDITPREIKNIEDYPTSDLADHLADPPSEKDRLPPALVNANASSSIPASSR